MKRDFKGVWIPAEIWLDENLSVMEKLFLVEIDSLDNEEGCFASNKHFAKFFGMSKSRCSEIITSLTKKGLMTSEYIMEGNITSMRILRVVEKLNGGIRDSEGGIRKTRRGYSENTEHINTINNTNNKNKLTFEDFYSKYPKKTDKKKAMQKWNNLSAKKRKDAIAGIECFVNGKESKYICSPTVYLNGERWEDEAASDGRSYTDEWSNMK